MNKITVVLVCRGKNLSDREFDRVPMKGECLVFDSGQNLLYVKEVFWREDGSASLLLSNTPELT